MPGEVMIKIVLDSFVFHKQRVAENLDYMSTQFWELVSVTNYVSIVCGHHCYWRMKQNMFIA